ncbi:MBL fold metallo-hydrolase, partial [Candidatus Latescibacterota bacterium]
MTDVASGIYTLDHEVVDGHTAVVVGTRAALAVDAGPEPELGEATADLIRRCGHTPTRLVLTHGHGDHVMGGAPLAGGEVFAHAQTAGVMNRRVPGAAARWGTTEEVAAARLPWPTVTFEQQIRLDLGGRTVRLIPTPGHSPGGISAFVEEDRLLIAGDTVVTSIVPLVGDGNSRVLEASLLRLQELQAEVLIPGHGPIIRGREAVNDWIRWEAGYLSRVRMRVREQLMAGASLDQATEAAGLDEMVGSRLSVNGHDLP